MKIRIGTRGSMLALWQAEHIKSELEKLYKEAVVELVIIKTTGDKILDVPLAKIGGKGLFTKEIEEAMLRDEIDIAVHSLKDVPVVFPEGLGLVAITEREDVRDCFLSEKYAGLDALPNGAKVGTTSLRRRMQILSLRPDLVVHDLRGNLQTRIQKLKDGVYDAILLATAGLNRLNIKNSAKYVVEIDTGVMIPAMGQAALGIEARLGSDYESLLKPLNHEKTYIEATIEREFIKALDGGCQVPIGINAKLDGEKIEVNAIIGLPDGSKLLKESVITEKEDFMEVGCELAELMVAQGAREILKEAMKHG